MAYLCRCPVCSYPKRIDIDDVTECSNAECAQVFVPIAGVAVEVYAIAMPRRVFASMRSLTYWYTPPDISWHVAGAIA